MATPDDQTPPQDAEEEESGIQKTLGECCLCRVLAPISIPALESRRHQVLNLAHLLCLVGMILAGIGFFGGYSWGTTLSYLSWATLNGRKGNAHAGVKWICRDFDHPKDSAEFVQKHNQRHFDSSSNPHSWARPWVRWDPPMKLATDYFLSPVSFVQEEHWKCQTWEEFNCGDKADPSLCEACRGSATGIAFSVVTAFVTYYLFKTKADARLAGLDSPFVKGTACLSGLAGGGNFLIAVLGFYNSCFHMAEKNSSDYTVRPGFSLICITIAAFLKVLVGVLHLGLRVEKSGKKSSV
jgi:hypothetical protein